MWLWIVLALLLVGIVWALTLVIALSKATALGLSLGIVALLVVAVTVRALLARRAATALEQAIARQGSDQARGVRPERRAEILELQKQLQAGIGALKKSKLGRGRERGAAALYSMPWYMIIGPPGAGKTTALKHSGLVFPYGGGGGGAVRGVGGTRNCDWWFTNEAILLDTAGRYTTQTDDREEWFSFLAFLKKYRPKRPINGVIVAISLADLVDANEQQIDGIGKALRARIDEVMTQLGMIVPVYFLFTKVDLVAGFVEFFGDLKKSDRAQCWGATLRLDLPKSEPGKLFDAEFDLLVQRVHARGLKRCVMERSREAREKLYQFPLEFAGLKRNLSELVAVAFQQNAFQPTPIFRGFYFTSGTQEGRPMDRVLGRMSAAMGIRHGQGAAPTAPVESKSYFLHDLFMNIIFPDGNIAARSALEEKRELFMKVLVAGATFALAVILAVPAFSSYLNNKEFLEESERRSKETAQISWGDTSANLSRKLQQLGPTREHLLEHWRLEQDGVPLKLSFWMYVADQTYRPKVLVYATQMNAGFVLPCKSRLEEQLKTASGDKYLEQRNLLRMYLMLGDPEHLDVEWATGRFTQLWADVAAQTADLSPLQLREAMRPHVRTYFELVKRKHVAPASLDASLVDRVRGALSSVPVDKRLYDFVVRSVEDLRVDEAGEPSIENQVFPPIMLPRVLAPDAQKFYLSKSNEAKQGYTLVSGAFTNRGQYGVFRQLEIAPAMLAKEEWVVPSGISEGEMVKLLTQVKNRYEEEFIQAWVAFFEDLRVKKPVNAEEAIELFRVVSTSEYPMRRLLQVLEDHTQWKNANPFEGNDAVLREANRRLENHINRYTQGVQVHVDLSSLVARMDRVPTAFLSATKFALTGPPPAGSSAVSTDSGVYTYAEEVKKLKNALIERKGRDPNLDVRSMSAEFEQTRTFAKNLLAKHDAMAVRLIEPLLTSPLEIGARPTLGQGVDPTKVDALPPAGNKWQNPQNWKVTNPTPFAPLRPRP